MSRDPVFTTRTDREDGFDLRAVAFGDEVVLARLYFAARDPLWRTVPLRAVRSQRTTTPDGFAVVVEAVSESPVMPMSVTIEYRAAGDELVARAVAVAGGDFDYNRIGLCLLLEFVVVLMLGHMIARLQPPDHVKMMMATGFALAIMTPAVGINYLYQRKSLKLFLIDAGHFVVGMAVVGLVFVLLD